MLKGEQIVEQLEKIKGGYFFLKINAETVNRLKYKNKTRLICKLDHKVSFQCGLNHYGDGNFFIIISSRNMKLINRKSGDKIYFEITEDPNPLGAEIPETVSILLEQDDALKEKFNELTDGKKRSILIQINKIKDLDKQVSKTIALINNPNLGRPKR
ncbi:MULTISPECIES: YdeI/OmpD-associated family protein [Chryseobacterium]|uniref:YdeI/OmpD-associated family protein n=1 Tax=Chryseobacterium TaxID=59732 RepID=UPI0004938A9A|nr:MULTISPECIES: YdeI/OmpD-associated family protein [Chryseobacterium]MDR6157088.1 hypothetical protein [Chryseobacterium sp. SLBN-27]